MFHWLHRIFWIIPCFLFYACIDKNKEKDLPVDEDFEIPQEEVQSSPVIKKNFSSEWYKPVSCSISESIPITEALRNIASKLEIKIFFNLKEVKNINYVAKNKPFIEVLQDIAELCEWKIFIKNLNCKILPDQPYMHSYSIPYLIGERKNFAETSYAGSDKNMSTANVSNSSSVDAFEELKKNIEMMALGGEGENAIKFSMHKQAGVLNVIAKQKTHRMIIKYINLLSKQIRRQVLIEAKIYEVWLYKKFTAGINWSPAINYLNNQLGIPVSAEKSVVDGVVSIGIVNQGGNAPTTGSILSYLRRFGKVSALSNPRLLIANNNTGFFKVVENKVFFKLKSNVSTIGSSSKKQDSVVFNEITSEIQTVPVGTTILVQPTIDPNGKITISLKPIITEVSESIDDPAYSLMVQSANKKGTTNSLQGTSSKVPIVKTRELDTVFTTEENKLVIIGGLLYSKKEEENDNGIIALKNSEFSEKREIVICMKAKIKEYESENEEEVFIE